MAISSNRGILTLPPNTLRVGDSDLFMPEDTVLVRRTGGSVEALDSQAFQIEFGDSGNNGTSFPVQPGYGDYRIFTRTDLIAGQRFYYVPTLGSGEWLSLSDVSFTYVEAGALGTNVYFEIENEVLNATKGPSFQYRTRVVGVEFSSGTNVDAGSTFEVRAGGVTIATHTNPVAQNRFAFTDPEKASAVVPPETPIQIFASSPAGGGNDTICVVSVKRAELP